MVLDQMRQWRERQRSVLRPSDHHDLDEHRDHHYLDDHHDLDGSPERLPVGTSAQTAEPDLIGNILPAAANGRVGRAASEPVTEPATPPATEPATPPATEPATPPATERGTGPGDAKPVIREDGKPVRRSVGDSITGVRQDAAEAETPGFGTAGKPLNRQSPFYVGFVGAFGVLVAYALWGAIGQMGEVFTLLAVALFLTLALDPIVQLLTRRGLRRGWAVTVVFVGLVAAFVGIGLIVVPPVASQGGALTTNAPNYFNQLLAKPWVQDLDKHYHVISKLQTQVQDRLSDQTFVSGLFGGVLGAGRAVVSGFFAFFTVLVLTLYFLGALPSVKRAAYAIVPATRRERVSSLSEEVFRRVGSYAIGQVAIASVNAFMSFIMMSIVDIPYPAVLAVAVGFLGLVPMVGAGLGAVVVSTVAVFDEPRKAVIAIVYYIVYQQIENYLIVPRIMQRTVSVPGAVTIVAALAGGTLLGMLGALLAIPVAAGLLLIYEEVLIPRQRHH